MFKQGQASENILQPPCPSFVIGGNKCCFQAEAKDNPNDVFKINFSLESSSRATEGIL